MSKFKEQVYADAIAAGLDEALARAIAERVCDGDPKARTKEAIATAGEIAALCRLCGHASVAAQFVLAGATLPEVRATLREHTKAGLCQLGLQLLAKHHWAKKR